MAAEFYLTYWIKDEMKIHEMNSVNFQDAQIEGKKALDFLLNLGASNIHITDAHGFVIHKFQGCVMALRKDKTRVLVNMTFDKADECQKIANEIGISRSDLINLAINQFFDIYKKSKNLC